jgi:hypothetical protein
MSLDTQSVKRLTTDWMARVLFPAGARDCSLFHNVQTGSGAHRVSYLMGAGSSLPWNKAAGAEWWSYTAIAEHVFMAHYVRYLICGARGSLVG